MKEHFDDLCNVMISCFLDCRNEKGSKTGRSTKKLVSAGIMYCPDDFEAAYTAYENYILEYAVGCLPDRFGLCYNGSINAACISDGTISFYMGDRFTRIMWFEDHDHLVEYTKEIMNQLHEMEETDVYYIQEML